MAERKGSRTEEKDDECLQQQDEDRIKNGDWQAGGVEAIRSSFRLSSLPLPAINGGVILRLSPVFQCGFHE